MSKRLLIIAQKVDETDDLLGFFVAWIKEFEKHFEHVQVITLEQGASKLRQAIRMIRLLWRYTPRDGAVFCHMSPIFAVVAWPFAVLRNAKLSLWYLHRSTTFRLRLAVALSDVVFTADTRSLTIKNKKIVAVGHGVDVDHWTVTRDWNLSGRPLRVLLVGRISPIKDIQTYIDAVKIIRERGGSVQARVVGRPVMPSDIAYADSLDHTTVDFVGFVPYRDMQEHYAWADIVVGCTPPGGIDKTLLEGMAAGCIVLTSNTIMGRYLEPYADQLIFAHRQPEMLAEKVLALHDFEKISQQMVHNVRDHFELSKTITAIAQKL